MRMLIPALMISVILNVFTHRLGAQGTVDFGNSTQPINTNGPTFGKIQAGRYVFGLYLGSTQNQLVASLTPVLLLTNAGFPGFITAATFTLIGYNTGDSYFFQVKGWEIGSGTTYETSTSFYKGYSTIGQVTLGGGAVAAGKLFFASAATTPNAVQGFVLGVPEPSTLCLFGAGLGALFASRRSKRRE